MHLGPIILKKLSKFEDEIENRGSSPIWILLSYTFQALFNLLAKDLLNIIIFRMEGE